jgi:hypothetical protein
MRKFARLGLAWLFALLPALVFAQGASAQMASPVFNPGSIYANVGYGGQPLSISVTDARFGAKCDVQQFQSTAGGYTVTSGSTTFQTKAIQVPASAVGKTIILAGVGAGPFFAMQHESASNGFQLVSGGTGGTYTVGATLTLVGGTPTGSALTIKVDTVSAGVITGWHLLTPNNTYSVVPTGTLATTSSDSGTGATFTGTWSGSQLVTTIDAVGGSAGAFTVTLHAAPSLSLTRVRYWAYGTLDGAAIQAAYTYSASNGIPFVAIPGNCFSEQQLELATNGPPYNNNPEFVGTGPYNSQIILAASQPYLIHRGTGAFGFGGGFENVEFNCLGLVTTACIGIFGGSGMHVTNVSTWNTTGSGVTGAVLGDGSGNAAGGVTTQSWHFKTDPTIFAAGQMPDIQINSADAHDILMTLVVADGASQEEILAHGAYNHWIHPHTFNSASPDMQGTYGIRAEGQVIIDGAQVDDAATAGYYLYDASGPRSFVNLPNSFFNCGEPTNTTANAIEIANNKGVNIRGFTPGANCVTSPPAAMIVQDGTSSAYSTVCDNSSDSIGTIYTFGCGPPVLPQGRLTLQTGVPVMTSDQTAKTTIFYASFTGGNLPLYNGVSFANIAIPSDQISMGLDAGTPHIASGSVYDVFVVNVAGVPTLCAGPAWSTTATRGTGAGTTQISRISGIWTNTVSLTHCWGGASGVTDLGAVAAGSGAYLKRADWRSLWSQCRERWAE